MDSYTRQPFILHLPGITLDDYKPIEDVFDEQVMEKAEKEEKPPEQLPFDKIPFHFTTVKEWPLKTNLRCWSCPFTFDGPPRFVPKFIREDKDGNIHAGVEGNFCTFNCAARYVDTTYPSSAFPAKHWRMRDNLCFVYHLFTGHFTSHIEPAPPKTDLLEYGGKLTQENFWKRLRKLDPLHGLRNHNPGSSLPERLRNSDARKDACNDACKKTKLTKFGQTIWSINLGENDLSDKQTELVNEITDVSSIKVTHDIDVLDDLMNEIADKKENIDTIDTIDNAVIDKTNSGKRKDKINLAVETEGDVDSSGAESGDMDALMDSLNDISD